ncbi:MAG: PIN domain-containing protein [Candidatus Solibacter sp.]|nr:PIN domain-containing protein [Candidatus Solibacter sp.]
MSRIYWDTMLFVYWIEDHPQHAARINRIRKRMEVRRDTLCSSVFTLGEVLTGFYKRGALEEAAQIRKAFSSPQIELLAFTPETAEQYGRIRAGQRVSPADAIHLASAAQAGVDLFLTHDHRLQRLAIPGIQFIAGMDVNLF